eukprot:TRINITY_DN3764_c0_g1_i2.p1 TRINITY_DN3764_c0_g1~~TRINITY_DN3764_c0_g1_i2.p1  ORF type:complete len:124 (+),score=25.58 TRINITY_DN3764_c0_g1_i2:285-656(+)
MENCTAHNYTCYAAHWYITFLKDDGVEVNTSLLEGHYRNETHAAQRLSNNKVGQTYNIWYNKTDPDICFWRRAKPEKLLPGIICGWIMISVGAVLGVISIWGFKRSQKSEAEYHDEDHLSDFF